MFGPGSSVEIDARQLERAMDRVKRFEPKLKNKLTKDLRGIGKEIIPELEAGIPTRPPLGRSARNRFRSGVARNWEGPVNSKVRTYPNAKPGRAIALINVRGGNAEFAKYLALLETAGTRTSGRTPQGKGLIRALDRDYPKVGSGGRFVFKTWLKLLPDVRGKSVDAINGYIKQFNKLGRF